MSQEKRRFQFNGEDALSLPARREAFTTLQEWLNSIAKELELPGKTRKQLLIAADEIFTNIANYGYPSGDGSAKVAVSFNMQKAELEMIFSDSGIPYNPLEARPPDLSQPLEKRTAGGLGIFLVKKLMDTVEYRRENNQNILVLKKRLHRESEHL